MHRETARTAKPLSVEERKASVAAIAETATDPKVKRGIGLIDFRPPTAEEKAIGETLVGRARRALARRKVA